MTTAGTPSAGMTTPPSTSEPYKFRRARKGRMLAGVCSGLATASGLDVTVVRICFGVSMLTGLGVIGYILLWIVIPEEQPSRGRFVEPAPENTARVIRVVLLGGALLVLLSRLGIFWPFGNPGGHTDFGFDGVLALILISAGVGVLLSRYRSDAWSSPTVTPPTAPPPSESFTPWTAPSPTPPADGEPTDLLDDDEEDDPDHVSFVGPLRDVATTVHRDVTAALSSARSEMTKPKKPGGAALGWARFVGWVLLLWWCAGLAVLIGLWRFDAVDIFAPAILFTVCGFALGFVLNALIRIRRPAVVLFSMLALLMPTGAVLGTVRAEGPAGARTVRPLNAPAVSNYRQAFGNLELDFSNTKLATSRPTRINARIGAGRIGLTVPDNVSLTVVSRVEAGGYSVLGRETGSPIGHRETLRFNGCEGAPHLQLFLRAGLGGIEVQRTGGGNEPTCPTPVVPAPAG